MKKITSILSILTVCLVSLSIVACSSFRNDIYNQETKNLTTKPLALATEAYELLGGDKNSKKLVADDLEHAYFSNGISQTVINRLLKKQEKTADEKDDELYTLAIHALNEKKPDFKKALTFARKVKKPEAKSEILLRIADGLPKNNRLPILREADKTIALNKTGKFVYKKRSKLLKLAKMYFESGDKKSATKTIIDSHKLLIRNTSSINAVDFGIVADLESQLGIHPGALCKLTRFLHKTKDRPVALAKITAAYVTNGYQGQVCIPDKALVAAVKNMPDTASQVREQLVLAEAWHARKQKDKSLQLYNGAIKSAKLVSPQSYQLDMMSKILISLKKTANKKLYNNFSNTYWQKVNKQSSYEQSSTLTQLTWEAYDVEGLTDLSFEGLRMIKDHSSKVITGVTLARMAHQNNDPAFAKQVVKEAFLAAKTAPYPELKIDRLRNVIDTADELNYKNLSEQALKVTAEAIAKVPHLEMKIWDANWTSRKAWEHKDYHLAQKLLQKSQLWYEQWTKKLEENQKDANSATDYYAENKNNELINLLKNNVLLGNNSTAIDLLNRLSSKKIQAKALVYAAIALAEKRKKLGASKTDKSMMQILEKKIRRIRKEYYH